MKKLYLPLILDVLFYSFAAFLVALGILRYYRLPAAICFGVSIPVALAVGIITFLLVARSRRRFFLNRSETAKTQALMLHLTLEKDERVRALLLAAICADGKEAHCEGDALKTEGIVLVPLFTMQPITADAVAVLLKKYGTEPFAIACNALTPEAEKLLATFGRTAVKAREIYELVERTNTMPNPLICGQIPKKDVRTRARRALSKRNARPFFVSGLLLLIMSLFTFFPVYYLISGSVLVCVSIFIRAFGYAEIT